MSTALACHNDLRPHVYVGVPKLLHGLKVDHWKPWKKAQKDLDTIAKMSEAFGTLKLSWMKGCTKRIEPWDWLKIFCLELTPNVLPVQDRSPIVSPCNWDVDHLWLQIPQHWSSKSCRTYQGTLKLKPGRDVNFPPEQDCCGILLPYLLMKNCSRPWSIQGHLDHDEA